MSVNDIFENKHDTEVFMKGFVLGCGNGMPETSTSLTDYINSLPALASYDFADGWSVDMFYINDLYHLELMSFSVIINDYTGKLEDVNIASYCVARVKKNGKFMWAQMDGSSDLWTMFAWRYKNGELWYTVDYDFISAEIKNIYSSGSVNRYYNAISFDASYIQNEVYYNGGEPYIGTGVSHSTLYFNNNNARIITSLSPLELIQAKTEFKQSTIVK